MYIYRELPATYAEPLHNVRVGREASATGELLVTGGADGDGVLHCAQAARVERAHVEDVNALHLAENLETLETGSLLEVGGHGTRLSAGADKVLFAVDLCVPKLQSASKNLSRRGLTEV